MNQDKLIRLTKLNKRRKIHIQKGYFHKIKRLKLIINKRGLI